MKKLTILTLFIAAVIGIQSCNKKEDSNVVPSADCANPNTDTVGTGLKIKYTGYEMTLPNSSSFSSGNPIYGITNSVMTVKFGLSAPAGFKRIEATKYEFGETTSFKNFPDNSIIATDTSVSVSFTVSNTTAEVKITIVDKNCKSTSYIVTVIPFKKSSVYSGKKIYSQFSSSPNSSFYSASKHGSYVSGGSISTMDINLAYKVGASPNYDPTLYSPDNEFGGLLTPKGQTVPTSGSPQTSFATTTKSLSDLTMTDLYQAIVTNASSLKIEAGKTYIFKSYTSPVTTYGAIKINSISGINNDEVDFDYVVLYK